MVFEHINFHHVPERAILHDISFRIASGKTMAVIGGSGSKKPTPAHLLLRFYDVTGGRMTSDGQDLRGVQSASLRLQIGVVPQDTILCNDSTAYDIVYGRNDASRDEIVAAARAAKIHDFIVSLA